MKNVIVVAILGTAFLLPQSVFSQIIKTINNSILAPYSNWESLGGSSTLAPAVAAWGPNRLDCFVRGTDKAMYHKWWDGSHWSNWESLGGTLESAPAAAAWGINRLDCFHRGTDNAMYHKWWDGSHWSGWENLGGILTSAPTVAAWGPNRLDCFVRGTDNAMHHKWWDGSHWSDWENLGGKLTSAPAVTSWGPNRLDCFVRGTDNAMYHKWWDGSHWSDWENLGGQLTEAPCATSWGLNRIDCFIRDANNALQHKWWDGSHWSEWEKLGGDLKSAPAAASWGKFFIPVGALVVEGQGDRNDVFAIGQDAAMWHIWSLGDVMTNFRTNIYGFHFNNTFSVPVVGNAITINGLCGGMVYAALDYYNQGKTIPSQTATPADHTPLPDYFLLRWKDASFSNGDKWAELFVNPFGARTGEFFNWGLQSTGGGRIQELKQAIDNGKPITLGLFREGSGGVAAHHVVLAIGYNMGRYSGNLNDSQANKESFRIYVYNPNNHDQVDVLRPNVSGNYYYLESNPSAHYTTYFVDSKYLVKTPPNIR